MSDTARERLLAGARSMSDDELRLGLILAAERARELVRDRQHWLAEKIWMTVDAMATARDERRALQREVDDAVNPCKSIGPAVWADE